MREERFTRSLASSLTALAVVFVPVYLLFGVDMARMALFFGLAATAIGMAAGWFLGKRHPAMQILAAVAPTAALAWLMGRGHPGGPAVVYGMMAAGVVLAVWTERLFVTAHDRPPRANLLMAPLAAWLISGFVLYLSARQRPDAQEMWPLIILPAVAWFSVAAVFLNRLGLRQAARAGSGAVPAGVRRSGVAGTIVFVTATLIMASVDSVVTFIAEAIRKLIYWVLVAFAWLATLFPFGSTEGGKGAPSDDMLLPEAGETSLLAQIISTIMIVLVLVAVVVAIIYGLSKFFPKLWQKLRERFGALFAGWRDSDDYRDRTESLLNFRQAVRDAGDQFRRFARRFRRRRRIGDFPTNAGRARFLFREYVRGLTAAGHEPSPSATASDIARPAPALASAYNLARYGEEEPGDQEIERAREQVKL